MICPQCETVNKDTAKFCNECGHVLPQAQAKPEVEKQEKTPAQPSLCDLVPEIIPKASETAVLSGTSAQQTADLSGLEKLVDSSYVPPAFSGQAGDTMEFPKIEGVEAPASIAFRAEDASKKKGSGKKIVLALLCLLLAGAAVVFATYSMELWGGKSVPDVVGESEENAIFALEGAGFTVRSTEVKSDDIEGLVLNTDPAPGARAEEGSEIILHLAVARVVPEIVGKTQEEAATLFEGEGLTQVTYAQKKSNKPAGTVLSVKPEQGEHVKSVTPVEVEVAIPFVVPDVAGKSKDEAVKLLEAEGYKVSISYSDTDAVPEGNAVETKPAAGSELNSGSEVKLYIARLRSTELINVTWDYLLSSGTFSIGGVSYEVSSVDDVKYLGDDTTEYAMTARPFETYYWFGAVPETRYGDYTTVTGTITWTDDNDFASASPTIERI